MSLVLDNVSKVVDGRTHIYPTTLTLEKGTMNVLLGPTLAGKTSLMRLMAGLDKPATGRVLWNGDDVTDRRVQDRNVAMVYQQFVNYPTLSVYENIASPLKVAGRSKAEIDAAVKKAAALMKLDGMLQRKPLELSGGQQQRCALARALVKEAGLVLLDEPLANLDYKLREELRAEIPAHSSRRSGAIFRLRHDRAGGGAAARGQPQRPLWGRGRVTQFGRTPDVLSPAGGRGDGTGVLGPADELPEDRQGRRQAAVRGRPERARARHARWLAATDAISPASGPTTWSWRAPHPGCLAFPASLSETEITGLGGGGDLRPHDHDGELVGFRPRPRGGALGADGQASLTVYVDPAHV